MKHVFLAGAFALASTAASAATLSFTLDDDQGSDSTDTDVVISDIVGGVSMHFTVNDPVNFSDLAAVYFDVGGGFSFTDLSFSSPAGTITGLAGGTNNIQAGNIGQVFDVGVAIGSTGSGMGEFFDDFEFLVLGTGLDVSAFFGQTFAVRGQTVGPVLGTGSGSSKNFGVAPDGPDTEVSPVPIPAAGLMLLTALGGAAALRRKS